MAGWIIEQAINKLSSLFSLATASSSTSASSSRPSSDSSSDESLEELRRLYRKMKRIDAVLCDADERDVQYHAQRLRLSELREVAYDAEDVIDEYQYEVLQCEIQSSCILDPASELVSVQATDELSVRYNSKRKRSASQQASGSSSSSLKIPISNELSVKVKRINEMFDEITKDWRDLNLQKSDGRKRLDRDKIKQRVTTSLVDEHRILGRKKEKEEIIQMVLSENASNTKGAISVLVITGLGGIGKTTIAQLIYNDQRISEAFDMRGWVCVPLNTGVVKLTRSIAVTFSKKKCEAVDLNNLQRSLQDIVEGKRFLLVLDDVWNETEVDWSKLRLPLIHARSGVLIVTTRNQEVTKVMQTMPPYALNLLPFDSCWSLFKQLVFGNTDPNTYPNLLKIGRKIVMKCGALPLAICALGNALRVVSIDDQPNEDEWLDVLNSELWEIKEGELGILPALKLSYDQMPSHLKRCFVIFSLFKKDHVFMKENIVKLWMSVDLVPLERKKLAEDIGGSYFDDLLQRSVIQQNPGVEHLADQLVQSSTIQQNPVNKSLLSLTGQGKKNASRDGYVMHDCFHDLAQFLALNAFSKSRTEMLQDLSCEPRILSGLGTFWPYGVDQQLLCRPRLFKGSQSFNANMRIEIQSNILIENIKHLRALDLSGTNIESLPDFVGILKQLRYLNVSNTQVRELPDSICLLYYLQTLDLRGCPLQGLPAGITSLINLRHLNFWGINVCMSREIGHLQNLITLPMLNIKGCPQHCGLADLKNLVKLRGGLNITGLRNVTSIESVKEAKLHTKKHLDNIVFDWCPGICHIHPRIFTGTRNANNFWEMVLDGLLPHTNLTELHVNTYPGLRFPRWLGSVSFAKMTKIILSNCWKSIKLPTLGSLPNLKFLSVNQMWNISHVGREFCSRDKETKGFKSLETLEIMHLPKWLSWWGVKIDEFCSLRTVTISHCPQLRSLPRPFSSSLTKLNIKYCKDLNCFPCVPMLSELVLTGEICDSIFYNSQFPSVRYLDIGNSESTISISLTKEALPSLEKLSICRCKGLQSVIGISDISSLRHLSIADCRVLKLPSNELGIPPVLETLSIVHCPAFSSSLTKLYTKDCKELTIVPSVPMLSELVLTGDICGNIFCNSQFPSLRNLDIKESEGKIPISLNKEALPSLEILSICRCEGLQSVTGISDISSLRRLSISYCRVLKLPSNEGLPPMLETLEIILCPALQDWTKELITKYADRVTVRSFEGSPLYISVNFMQSSHQ